MHTTDFMQFDTHKRAKNREKWVLFELGVPMKAKSGPQREFRTLDPEVQL
jgi:hypothetical protein